MLAQTEQFIITSLATHEKLLPTISEVYTGGFTLMLMGNTVLIRPKAVEKNKKKTNRPCELSAADSHKTI